jgi:hypothetical protein
MWCRRVAAGRSPLPLRVTIAGLHHEARGCSEHPGSWFARRGRAGLARTRRCRPRRDGP